MRISEITSLNKPYIRVFRGKRKVDIPIAPKIIMLPASKSYLRDYAFIGCDSIKFNYKGKSVKLNWTFNHNKMTLYCTSGRKAYCWRNVRVATVINANGKKEHIVFCKRAYGDETERRRFKRYPMIKNVTIIQGNKKFAASTLDISYGGVGLKVNKMINLVPSEPIKVDFGESIVSVHLVRTIFSSDGSEIFGCSVSSAFRSEMSEQVRTVMPVVEYTPKKEPKPKEDAGWSAASIKRWH